MQFEKLGPLHSKQLESQSMHKRKPFAYLSEGHESLHVLTSRTLDESHSVQLLSNLSSQLRQSGWHAVQTVNLAKVDYGQVFTQT